MSLSLALPVQAQIEGLLSGIPGLTPPEANTGQAVETLCPKLDPRQTAGATADLQIRCTELVGNAASGNTNAVRSPLLAMAPEEAAAQGMHSVEFTNRNIGVRLAGLRGVVTGLGFRRFTLQDRAPALPGTLVASVAPYAALSSVVPGSTPSPLKGFDVFINGTLTRGDKDATSREAGFDFTTLGATLGADYRFSNNFVLGVALSYTSTKADFDPSSFIGTPAGGKVDTRTFSVSLYGTYYVLDKFYVDGIVSLGWDYYDMNRNIIYSIPATDRMGNLIPGATTTVNQTARGGPNGNQYSFSFGGGYDFTTHGFTFGPLARLEYIKLNIDAYQEKINNTGNGFGLALAFNDQDIESLQIALGGQASYAISTSIGVLLPQVRFEWRHEFENNSRTITARFVSDPARTPLGILTDAPDRDFFTLGTGASATFRGGVSAFVYYETVLGLAHVTAHNVVLGARLEF